ncbi:flavin reductase family protein [Mucilaginibacter corticis]|uniref:Flavin reductase family protein n=1 Tax=Mucilaginibacter corticis TaxID=2597670 RepID=A0A556MKV1_9SPHI|nr:flavin reductase family protein [Mucilaginibacter corticis]TSJ40547.1 flavin reductase family protein [Mucilaginibacter corticis]
MKSFKASELSVAQVHNYLQHAVAPRPIALVSTIDRDGKVNLSPFSFFNLFSANPPVVIFSPSRRVRDNTTKHTLDNLYEVRECVVNMVDYAMVTKVNQTSAEYAKGINEFNEAGLTPVPSVVVRPPRVAESPVQLECRVKHIMPLGTGPGAGNLVIAEVEQLHFNEKLFDDDGKVVQQNFDLVARMGADWYCRTTDLFELKKPI